MKKKWMNGSVSGSKKTSSLSAGGIAAGCYYFNRPSCAADEVVRHRCVCAFGHDDAALCAAGGRMRKKYDIGHSKKYSASGGKSVSAKQTLRTHSDRGAGAGKWPVFQRPPAVPPVNLQPRRSIRPPPGTVFCAWRIAHAKDGSGCALAGSVQACVVYGARTRRQHSMFPVPRRAGCGAVAPPPLIPCSFAAPPGHTASGGAVLVCVWCTMPTHGGSGCALAGSAQACVVYGARKRRQHSMFPVPRRAGCGAVAPPPLMPCSFAAPPGHTALRRGCFSLRLVYNTHTRRLRLRACGKHTGVRGVRRPQRKGALYASCCRTGA